jgi:hypothetical protein
MVRDDDFIGVDENVKDYIGTLWVCPDVFLCYNKQGRS